MVPMEEVLSTDTKTFSYTFPGLGIGYMIGAVVCGVCIARVNQEALFVISTLLTAAATAAAPFSGHIAGFIALITLQSAAMGCIDTGANVYGLALWSHLRFQEPLMQALHCVWCVGATVGPFVVQLFIPPNNVTQELPKATSPTAHYGVEFSYIAIAFLVTFMAIPFTIVFITSRFPHKSQTTETQKPKPVDEEDIEMVTITTWSRWILLAMLFVLSALYYSLECTTSNFISAFTVKHLSWEAIDAPFIASVYWAGLGIGRFVNIFVSVILTPASMLLINICLIISSFIILLLVDYSIWCLWFGVALAGYGMSSTFVSIVLWASKRMTITGMAAAVFVVGGSVGCTVCAPVIGLLFNLFTPMSLIYVNLCVSVMLLMLFFLVSFFAKMKVKHGRRERSVSIEKIALNVKPEKSAIS
ncbi:hypothetical protein CAPTEDRAFT_205436 [Capitella teleta]|uniref:Major facilitator superfamily (MFS) profile domain-containing protein n=1 Tax=Capitella teleta TaxID=283909 RepID=R7U2K4_CAPTE|nr:hypothetical protein CAPTEDRAFT_205436 [Capitella teleta]|eukprot:ELT97395.1 hypothetical protein CAPTEDRAFT_205436 [Capitella teleta]